MLPTIKITTAFELTEYLSQLLFRDREPVRHVDWLRRNNVPTYDGLHVTFANGHEFTIRVERG